MILRTPRRRISPRTKRRYRAIKDFVRRALRGTSSQRDSVSDLKSQILDIEQQLNKVSKHCQDLSCLEHTYRKESQNSVEESHRHEGSIHQQDNCGTDSNDVDTSTRTSETKLLHKSSTSQPHKSDENHYALNNSRHDDTTEMASSNQRITQNIQHFQFKQNDCDPQKIRRKGRAINISPERTLRSKYKTVGSIYSTSSFHSLVESGYKHYTPGCSSHRHKKRHTREEYTEPFILKEQRDIQNQKYFLRSHRRRNDEHKAQRTKRVYSEVDKDFISEIIRRQYRPVKLFGRRDSDFSQFSAPVCRDQEFTVRNEIQEGIDLCSCCFDECKKRRHRLVGRHTDHSDTRSICDTRLYSSKNHRKHKRYNYVDDYNNSALYDIVPVKEKSSPKARRKFIEENMIEYQSLREVPPSPRTHRPRLNLKVQQYADYEDSLYNGRYQTQKKSPTRAFRKNATNALESDVSSVFNPQKRQVKKDSNAKFQKPIPIYEDVGTMSNLLNHNYVNENVTVPNNDTTINTQFTDSTTDKTDKTLSEIKDILRSFLFEIKKESISSNKSDDTSKIENKQLTQHEGIKTNSNIMPNSGHSFMNYGVGQCGLPPYVPPFPNPCCYPIIPMCPMNCMQNGYIIPSPSYTCAVCAKTSKENGCPAKVSVYENKPCEEAHKHNETQELIKEIYKFVSQKPKSPRTDECGNEDNSARSKPLLEKKVVTNRHTGGSMKGSKHDANVGTPHLKYNSKSCEAIGSRIVSDTHNTNASYSDTVLEKLSLEATQSSTETDISSDVPRKKVRRAKVKKGFNPWKLFRKKKRDVIEELSESESTVEVEVKPRPPFKQNIQSYAMHGAEYYQPPPCCGSHPRDCCHGYEPGPSHQHPRDVYNDPRRAEHIPAAHYNPTCRPTSPYPHDHYHQVPQVPLCLKEVEVKSIGTQSERKVSILQKLANKIPTAAQQEQEATRYTAPVKEKPNFWKMLQEKAKQNDNDPMNFSLKMQKQLAQGDIKMKNAMMKKLFYKKNPFSPRNLIVRTLLGKDKSSYGNPPKMYRPRMFV